MTKWIQAAAIAALAAFAADAGAQRVQPVETQLEARKVVPAADGKETFAPANQARPGDVIEYVATYRNNTPQAVRDLDATLPIPAETEFLAGTDKPSGARASLDGKAFAAMPLTRKVLRDGREIDQAVPTREYRALRWRVDALAPGKPTVVSVRVRVLDDRTTGPPATPGGGR